MGARATYGHGDEHGKNAGHRPKIGRKMINFIALWDFQTG